MPIQKITLENFKTHVRTEIPLSPLTVLVGPNSVGKTSVLEAIRVVAQMHKPHEIQGDEAERPRFVRQSANACSIKLALSDKAEVSLTWRDSADSSWECAWKVNGSGGSALVKKLSAMRADRDLLRILKKIMGTATQLRLDADRLAAPSTVVVGEETTGLSHDGSGLAGVLGIIRLFDQPRFDDIERELRSIVRSLEHLRIVKVPFSQMRREYDEHGDWEDRLVNLEGAEIRFDFLGAKDIRAGDASEGTLIALGVLTAARAGDAPRIVLLDDIERALHPHAQRQLVGTLHTLIEKTPGLQIIATTHSPYLVDAFRPEEVIVLGLRKDGTAAAKRLSDHPDAKRAMEVLSTGEFLAAEQEDWVVEEPQ